jgi:hypothetical protein
LVERLETSLAEADAVRRPQFGSIHMGVEE